MPTLVLQDVPVDIFKKLAESASRRQVSPEEEAKRVLRETFGENNGQSGSDGAEPPAAEETSSRQPGPIFLTPEIPAPFSLPRGEGVVVKAVWGGQRQPGPIGDDEE